MGQATDVLIGIQARSTSTRFPEKVFELIGGKPLLQHVIDACVTSTVYINKLGHKKSVYAKVAVLCPEGDKIATEFSARAHVVTGSEDDVLSRYVKAAKKFECDYIVRVTGDCPLIPPHLITKHINAAVMNGHDYVSNVDERLRTSFDGLDCEVVSRRALEWLDENARSKEEREHVTVRLRTNPPEWLSVGHVIGYLNLADMMLSVNTKEDLARVREQFDSIEKAINVAERISGPKSVYRY